MTTKVPAELSSTPSITDAGTASIDISGSSDPIFKMQGSGHPQLRLKTTGTTDNTSVDFGDSDSETVGRLLYNHANDKLSFTVGGTEVMNIESDGNITTGGANISVLTGTSYISLADDATYSINSSGNGGAALLAVYEAGSGDNALFHVGYNGSVVVSSQNNTYGFAAADTDGKICVIKSGHSLTFKNRTGITRLFYISAYGGGNTDWNL